MTLRLHWSPDSANLPVRIALEMFGLPYEAVRVDRAAGEHRSAAYREMNPQGLIPVLEDGALILFETGAILWHLAEKVGRLGPDGPAFSDDSARVLALRWMFYLSNTLHADLRIAFNPQNYIEDDNARAQLAEGVATRIRGHFDLIEAQRRERPLDLTDIYFAVMARWAQLYPMRKPTLPNLNDWPLVRTLCQKIETHPAAMRAFEAEFIVAERALTSPRVPELSVAEITGL